MKKLISVLSIALFISSASAQSVAQSYEVNGTNSVYKEDPVIIILCMPFPSCEKT